MKKDTTSRHDELRRQLGLDEEDLQAELEVLEQKQAVQETKADQQTRIKKVADRLMKESSAEKEKKKAILSRLKVNEAPNPSNNAQKRRLIGNDFLKGEGIKKTVENFDIDKKKKPNTTDIFLFRKKQAPKDGA